MIKIDVRTDFAQVQREIDAIGKQARFAAAKALTQTAVTLRQDVASGLSSELDRPKPQTTRAMRVEKATRDNLTAVLRFTNRGEGVPAAEYLAHNITGGQRGLKRSELMLRAAGILPPGLVTIPGKAAKLDAYGNMSRGQIVSILSYFRAFGATALNSGRMNRRAKGTRSKAEYFVVPVRDRRLGLYPGIWRAVNRTDLEPLLMFVSPGVHRKLIKLDDRGRRVVARDFNRLFNAALLDALRSERR